jgi:hypothetical protein
VGELAESLAGVAGWLLLIGLALGLGYQFFGSQVFGLPALVGVLVLIALGSAFSTMGLLTLGLMVAGLVVLFIVIGVAMTLGPERIDKARDERPKDG